MKHDNSAEITLIDGLNQTLEGIDTQEVSDWWLFDVDTYSGLSPDLLRTYWWCFEPNNSIRPIFTDF